MLRVMHFSRVSRLTRCQCCCNEAFCLWKQWVYEGLRVVWVWCVTWYVVVSSLYMQHPDLIEKRRKVFGERIARYIRPQPPAKPPKPPTNDSLNGTEGPRQRIVNRATV